MFAIQHMFTSHYSRSRRGQCIVANSGPVLFAQTLTGIKSTSEMTSGIIMNVKRHHYCSALSLMHVGLLVAAGDELGFQKCIPITIPQSRGDNWKSLPLFSSHTSSSKGRKYERAWDYDLLRVDGEDPRSWSRPQTHPGGSTVNVSRSASRRDFNLASLANLRRQLTMVLTVYYRNRFHFRHRLFWSLTH